MKPLFLTALLWIFPLACLNAQQPLPELFPAADDEALNDPDAKRIVAEAGFKQAAIMRINTDAILNAKEPTKFGVNFLDLKNLTISLKEVDSPSADSRLWRGTIAGSTEECDVFLVLRPVSDADGEPPVMAASATLHMDGRRVFEIRWVKTTIIVMREIDPTKLPRCGLADPVGGQRGNALVRRVTSNYCRTTSAITSSPYVVTLAVFYTDKAKDGAGSDVQIKNLIDMACDQTQCALDVSDINVVLHLAYTAETDDDECWGHEAILGRLKTKADGHMDEVHTQREYWQADVVALICEDVRYAGWAYRMKVEHISHRSKAFCTVSRGSATSQFSFAHELGHLFGCCHKSPPAESDPIALDAYGWDFDYGGEELRTIMHSDYDRERVLHFSNPFIAYPHFGGEPTGITTEADNARIINATAVTVSQFGDSL